MTKEEKIARVFKALSGNAKKVVSKSLSGEAIFFLGENKITVTEKSVSIGDRIWKI